MKKASTILLFASFAMIFASLSSCQSAPAASAAAVVAEADATAAATESAPSTFAATPSVDSMSAASGKYYYEAGMYSPEQLKAALAAYPYAGSVTIATVNEDGSPNLTVAIPGLSADGQYLMFGFAENRTKANMIARKFAVVGIYDYKPTAESKADRNRGCRLILEYPGDEANAAMNAGKARPSLYMKIVKILPLG